MSTNEQAPAPVEGDEAARPASEQPVEAIDAGREEMVERLARYLSPGDFENRRRSSRNQHAANKAKTHYRKLAKSVLRFPPIKAALSPASPARTPMGGPQVLKGVGKINGDGWKDTTTIGEVVYVWNAEKPSPYAPGQYPRIGNEGWSASTAQYDFSPASIDEVRALAAPTPMGRKVEAKWAGDSNVLRVGWLVEVLASDPLPAEIINGHQMPRLPGRTACWVRFWPNGRDAPIYRSCDLNDLELSDEAFEALAASSPSPAQGGEFDALEDWEHDDQRELSRLYRHRFDDSLQFNRGQMRTAIRHGRRIAALSASPQPEAGEARPTYRITWEDDATNPNDRRMYVDGQQWAKVYGWNKASLDARCSILTTAMAAPPSVQPVEGK